MTQTERVMRPDPDTCRDPDLLAAEVRRLRAVIDSGSPALTDEEREAIERAISREMDAEWYGGPEPGRVVALRGLLERTK
jgi:hypothetical protein